MSARFSFVVLLFAAFVAAMLGGCDRELRKLSKPASGGPVPTPTARQSPVLPGQPGEGFTETSSARTFDPQNAYELNQGKQLFRWYNCAGCHQQGGGGMGPALMDDKWIYGHEPDQIYDTIMNGRPNGMPSFRGRIPSEQVWQLVAYVRSMSGQSSKAAAPSRSDSLAVTPPENQRTRETPRTTGPELPTRTP